MLPSEFNFTPPIVYDIHGFKCISTELKMKIAKWGNSLAVRLPARIVETLSLKEGDEIDLRKGLEKNSLFVRRKLTKKELRERVKSLRGSMPPGFKFNRDEIGEG